MRLRTFSYIILALGLLETTISASYARDIESACWFYAGFDTPVRIAGGRFPCELVDAGFRDGRFGKGYYFHSPTENDLPPMAEYLAASTNFIVKSGKLSVGKTLKFSGGVFQTAPRHVSIRNLHPWVSTLTGYTCSFFVKGPKGAQLTARVGLKALNAEAIEKVEKRCGKGGNWRKLSDASLRPDVSSNEVWTLTGDWQRVYAYAQLDNRVQPIGREVSLGIACEQRVEIKDFQFQQTSEYPRVGNFSPTPFVDGGSKVVVSPLCMADPAYITSFPAREGSFVVWVKCFASDAEDRHAMPLWGFACPWSKSWGFNGRTMRVNGKKELFYQDWNKYTLPFEWRHYAATWKDGIVRLYIDGKPLETRTAKGLVFDDVTSTSGGVFRLGSRFSGDGATDALVDEFAIFSLALTDEEIAMIADSDNPLFDGSKRLLSEPVSFTTFFRNQRDAAIRTRLYAPKGGRYKVKARIGGETLPTRELDLQAGDSKLAIPFDPALFSAGKFAWEFSLVGSDGEVALTRFGELEIRGRLERDKFRIMSWGGNKRPHNDFLKTCGINAVNCNGLIDVGRATRDGLLVNIRYENHKKLEKANFDYANIASQVAKDLAYADGLHTWVSTLVNSEVYGVANVRQMTNSAAFSRIATEEIGVKPEWSVGKGLATVDYSKLGEKPPVGIVDGRHPTFLSLRWFMDSGMPCYRLNGETAREVHRISFDNEVWTEPILAPGGQGRTVDMMADWIYEYDANITLSQLRSMSGMMRGIGKPFIPTLGCNYWPEQKGANPATPHTKVVTDMGQSCDENMIKSWMAIGAVNAAHLHVFAADSWEYGVSNAVAWAKNRLVDVPQIAEPDAPRRFGEFVRTRLEPAACLLRGIDNMRAPIAYMLSAETEFAASFGWDAYWYPRRFTAFLCRLGVPFDYLHEHEITEEILSKYSYVIFPMSRIVTKRHDDVLKKAAAKGTAIVLDSYATFSYPNAVQLPLKTGPSSQDGSFRAPFRSWFTNRIESIRAELPAWSDSDFTGDADSYTFTKEYEGVKYVTVVNNRRRVGGSILTEFKTNEWYKPCGAPLRTVTHIKCEKSEAVYEFGCGRLRPRVVADSYDVEGAFAPAEGKVFVVYPRPLDRIELALTPDCAAGRTGWVDVSVFDKSGKCAPGRQVVELTLTAPDGTSRDESGLYAVHGKTRVPLRFAKGEEAGSAFKRWKVTVRELTSGLEADKEFLLKR